jgi:hypothetical protein
MSGRKKSEVEKNSEFGSQKTEVKKKTEVGVSNAELENTSALDTPNSEIETLPTANLKLQTENTMEVHHHPEVERKGLKEYLLEGLMIFLAVMMGFFAENLRETISNNHHENELAKALYTELSADSAAAAGKLEIRSSKEKDLDYLCHFFKDSSLTKMPRGFYPAFTTGLYMINIYAFEPKDGILSQLKNSGTVRYFKSIELQKLLGDLSVSINNIRFRNDQEYQFFANPLKPFLLTHYDFSWLDHLRQTYPTPSNGSLLNVVHAYLTDKRTIEGSILNTASINRAETTNLILFYKQILESTHSLQLDDYIAINKKILQVLRKNYSLQNE